MVGVDQRILHEKLVEVIAQEFVVGTPEFVGKTTSLAEVPECQWPLL
jgi:hypothetical protein